MGARETPFADTFHDSMEDAFRDAQVRKMGAEPVIVTVEPSPYGGWRVRSLPAEFAVDMMSDTIAFGGTSVGLGRRVYR